jgi:uncharacterized protein
MSENPEDREWVTSLSREEMAEIQRRLQTQFAAIPLAFSTDGKTFSFEAPLDYPLPSGSYVQIETETDQFVGQIIDKSIESRQGPELALNVGDKLELFPAGMSIDRAMVRPRIRYVSGGGMLLGKVVSDQLQTPGATDVFQSASLSPATPELINLHLRSATGKNGGLVIGRAMYGDDSSSVSLSARGFGRHTFLCGQSGSGKTYSLGVVLEQLLLRSQLRMVVLDPNSDYVRLGDVRPDASLFHRSSELAAYEQLKHQIQVWRPEPLPGAPRLSIRFRDLNRHEQAIVLQLDPLRDREEYSGFWRLVESIGGDVVELNDVLEASIKDTAAESRQINLRVRNLGVSEWSIWCRRDEPSCVSEMDGDWRAMVIDIGTLGLTAEKEVVTLAMLSQLWRRRNERKPTLIVIDEAHNICPAEPETALSALLTDCVIRIAAEGRKFGLYLLLASQRPQKIHPNVLSQCDNLMLMRMNSIADLTYLSELFSFVSPNLLSEASHFRQGDSLLAGPVVPTATLAQFGRRISEEGGSDVPSTWASASGLID